ncbi:hypothetical protein AAVH_07612 [Aphelenchoides avenae]|nr:hypothetical protein AAVH_07612 [Aphelenchus avenae]
MDKNKRIVELNGYLRLCDSLSTVLGCDPADLQKGVHELVTATATQNSKIDDLQQRLANTDVLQDHSECERRISELQDELNCKDVELATEVDRVQLLSQTVKDLRDALSKKNTGGGIRPSLDARLQQLGFSGSSEDVGSSAATANRYRRYGTTTKYIQRGLD